MTRPTRLTALKIVLSLLTLLVFAAYGAVLWHDGRISSRFGQWSVETADFYWRWMPDSATLSALFMAGLFIALGWAGWGRSRSRRERRFLPPTLTMLTLWLALLLVMGQALPWWPTWTWPMPLYPGVLALLAAWFLFRRDGAGRIPADRVGDWLAGCGPSDPGPFRRWGRCAAWTLLALAGVALAWASCQRIYRGFPIITDSQSQIAQARLLLHGHWRLEISQALRDVISFPYAIHDVPSYSQYPPGYILPLAAELALRLPAQAIDILGAAGFVLLTGWLATRLARQVAGVPVAHSAGLGAAWLLLGSPFFLGLSGSGMNHQWAALLLLAAVCCFIKAGDFLLGWATSGSDSPAGSSVAAAVRPAWPDAGLAWAGLGGLALGWAVITRPVTGLAHGLVWAGATLVLGWRLHRDRPALRPLVRLAGAVALGLALPAAIFLYYNLKTTGHPLVMGYQVSNPALHRLGFDPGFTPRLAFERLVANIFSLHGLLFGWAIGSWTVLAVWWLGTRLRPLERLLLALIALQTAFYTVYHFHDLFLGPRFLYELLPLFCALAAAGLARAARRGGWRAALLGLAVILFSAGGPWSAFIFWKKKANLITGGYETLARFMCSSMPLHGPTVVVIDDQETNYPEMVGQYFLGAPGGPPLWFVPRSRAAQARALPELAGYRWLEGPDQESVVRNQ